MKISRRQLLKNIGLGTGAFAMLPSTLSGKSLLAPFVKGFSTKTSVLIGNNWSTERFAQYAQEFPGQFSIVGLVNYNPDKKQQVTKNLGISSEHCFTDYKNFFAKERLAEQVIIAGRDHLLESCYAALDAGYHIWLDRPASYDSREVQKLNEAAAQKNLSIRICHVAPDRIILEKHSLPKA
jgi:hypothetical protein